EPVSFQTTVTFEPQGKKTLITMRAVFPTAAEHDRVVKEYDAIEGGKQMLERLDEHLVRAAGTGTSRAFTISRVFDAPRELVWKAHSELESLKQWWGPKGFTSVTGTLDFRSGGMFSTGCGRRTARKCGASSSISSSSSLSGSSRWRPSTTR